MKRFLCFLLCVLFIMCASDFAFAAEADSAEEVTDAADTMNLGVLAFDEPTTEEQLDGLTKEQQEIVLEKLQTHDEDSSDDEDASAAAATYINLSGFKMYKQETTYYCVPACCKAAVQYLTGSSDSQSEIASELGTIENSGTPFIYARSYLNAHQSENVYAYKSASNSLLTMKSDFYYAIVTCDAPPLASVAYDEGTYWEYTTSGHAICISGVSSDKSYVKVADPYIQWVNSSSSMISTKLSSTVYDAIVKKGYGYIF